jgi:hypothetical protein
MKYDSIVVESIYQYFDSEPLWADVRDYFQSNSNNYLVKQITIEKTGEPIGGFSESIIISIVSNLIYDLGKHYIIELLNKIKKPANLKSYMEDNPPKYATEIGYPGIITLNIKFKDNKTVYLEIPFPIDSYNTIDEIDFKLIENQFLYDNTAKLAFNKNTSKYFKGNIFDTFI